MAQVHTGNGQCSCNLGANCETGKRKEVHKTKVGWTLESYSYVLTYEDLIENWCNRG